MFSSLQNLFGRDFAVGFFLPATVFSGASVAIAERYGLVTWRELWDFIRANQGLSAVLAAFLLWLIAISLHAANSWIIRRMEGYVRPVRLRRWLSWRQRLRFRELRGRKDLESRRRFAAELPHREDLLLPSTFGNVVRAFEAYPRVMYGFEATRGWSRLLTVVPKEFREVIDSAKAEVDFLVNLWFVSWLLLGEYLLGAWLAGRFAEWWIPLAAFGSVLLASYWSRGAAMRWGETVKGAFDVFLPDLRRQLGLPRPATREEELRMWQRFSTAFLLRDREQLLPFARPDDDEAGEPPEVAVHLRCGDAAGGVRIHG